MKNPCIREMPDVPEISQEINKCVDKIKYVLTPIIDKYDGNIFINSYLIFLLKMATCQCENQDQIDQSVKTICQSLLMNSERCFEIFDKNCNEEKEDDQC